MKRYFKATFENTNRNEQSLHSISCFIVAQYSLFHTTKQQYEHDNEKKQHMKRVDLWKD